MPSTIFSWIWQLVCGALLLVNLLTACDNSTPPSAPISPPLGSKLVFYDWPDNMPQSILEAFTAKYGVQVEYLTYASQEEMLANLRTGKMYDVVTVENQYISSLASAGLLAKIDYRNVPNFKNISANFRDLASDPGNQYTVPFNWGTTGLLVRGDLVGEPVTKWSDLWEKRFAGKVIAWNMPRYMIGIALKSLGYSINSENPAQLEAALERLIQLKSHARILDYDPAVLDEALASGAAVALWGFSGDLERARKRQPNIRYILPAEGIILWGDSFIIPANSPNKLVAELFINFLLEPEIIARFTNEIRYATPNEAATPFIQPQILKDPAIFPPNEILNDAEILLSISPAAEKLYGDIWARFTAGSP